MKTLLTTNWHLMRILRVGGGIVALIFAILENEPLLGLAAGFLLLTGIFNTGCCGVTGCPVPPPATKHKPSGENNDR